MTSMTDRKNAAISRGVGMTTQIYADRAENAEIWDKDGNRYIQDWNVSGRLMKLVRVK